MKKTFKHIFIMMLSMAFLMSQIVIELTQVYAQDTTVIQSQKDNSISVLESRDIAMKFVEANNEEGWSKTAYIKSYCICRNSKNKPSAYVFDIADRDFDEKCYVVVAACKNYAPIIEYGFDGHFSGYDFKRENEEIVYEGGMTYYLYDTQTESYYTCDNAHENIDYDETNNINLIDDNIQLQWENIDELDKIEESDVNAETVRVYGSSPYKDELSAWDADYIEGSKGNDIYTINKKLLNPQIMYTYDDIPGIGNGCCAPVAALNLLNCYYSYSSSYKGLMQSGNNDAQRFKNTFLKLYDLMKTKDSGTTTSNIEKGLQAYLRRYTKYVNSKVKYIGMINFNAETFIAELKANRPVLILTNAHICYKNHAMVCVGLRSYSNGALYYAVYDGHNEYVRYMHYAQGNAYATEAITMHLYK